MELKLMSGTGNTFVLANLMSEDALQELQNHFPKMNFSEISKHICEHHLVDVDGAVFVIPSDKYDFKWLFYNRDGSEAEMCGNASRCVTQFAHDEKIIVKVCCFETLAGTIKGEILDNKKVKVQMPALRDIQLLQNIKNNNLYTKYDYMDSGVPHCVIKVKSIDPIEDLRPLALQLRKPEFFAPRGANITFKVPLGKNKIEAISFERGIEDFTEACGTGAVAAAYSHATENGNPKIVNVSVPGGELTVEFTDSYPYLTGTVKYLGTLLLDTLSGDEI